MSSQNPSSWNSSWLSNVWATMKDPESEWLVRDNPETITITIKPKIESHIAEQFSWVPSPSCLPPGCPFPIKSLALSTCVSLQTIHFWVLDNSPLSGPGRGPHFLQPHEHCVGSSGKWTLSRAKASLGGDASGKAERKQDWGRQIWGSQPTPSPQLQSKDCPLEGSHVGQKWPGPVPLQCSGTAWGLPLLKSREGDQMHR